MKQKLFILSCSLLTTLFFVGVGEIQPEPNPDFFDNNISIRAVTLSSDTMLCATSRAAKATEDEIYVTPGMYRRNSIQGNQSPFVNDNIVH